MVAPARQYRDLNLSFILHPATNDVSAITNADAVRRSIRNLVLTNYYERPFRPSLGSGVAQLLFEPITAITSQRIKTAIQDVIRGYEPRADLLGVDVEVTPDRNAYEATITFHVVNQIDPVTVSVFLERIR